MLFGPIASLLESTLVKCLGVIAGVDIARKRRPASVNEAVVGRLGDPRGIEFVLIADEHEPLLSVAEGGVPGGEEIGGVRRTASWRARTTD